MPRLTLGWLLLVLLAACARTVPQEATRTPRAISTQTPAQTQTQTQTPPSAPTSTPTQTRTQAGTQTQMPEPTSTRAMLWKVSDGDNAIYLLGSFHALRAGDYPLPTSVDAAFADAEALAFEVDPGEMESPAISQQMLASAYLPAGQRLQQVVPAATWAKLAAYCRDNGLALESFQPMAPWFVSLSLSLRQMGKLGFDPKLGLDRHLMARAERAGKPAEGLETAAAQIAVLAGMPLSTQLQFLQEALDQDGKDSMDSLHRTWRLGDDQAMERLMVDELASKYAELYRRINVDRNQAWLPRLRAMLDDEAEDETLVVVGSLHLLGRDGLVQQLAARGYRVERL